MEWWNGIWLNEAFATFMELSCIDAYRPDWQVWNTFVAQRARAFDTDALVRTRPIEFEVNTPSEADAMFDVLTYEKGAAVLRMFEQWAGPDNFREGVRSYLQTHQYANTDATDLWAALSEATGTDVTSMMNTWILQGGHPLITAAVDGADVAVSQLPMTYLAAEDRASLARTWVVPARIRTIDVHGAVSDVSVELASNAVTIHGQAPIAALDLNHGSSGFYRQLVDPRFELAEAFRPDQLAPADRATRIDNATALLLAQRATPQHLLDTLRWFAPTEQHPLVWRVIAKSLDTLAMLAGPISLPSIARFAQGLLEPARSVQRPTTEEGRETDALLLRLAGTVANDPAAITESLEVFERQIRGETVDPDLAEAAFMVTGAHGGPDATQRLLTAFREAPTPQERLRALDAMGATRNPERLEAFCRLCLTEVRTQDAATALTRAMGQRPLGPQVWTYVERNWKALDERLPTASFDRLPAGIRAFGEPGFVASTTSFLDEHPRPQAAVAISQHLERAAVNARCRQAVGVELNKALDAPNPAS
jgi:puromycin-sensitive aminopeptidase